MRLALRQPRRTDTLAGAANFLSSAGDPRPVSRIIAAWAPAACATSCTQQRPPHPAPRLLTLMKRPLQQGRDDYEYNPNKGKCQALFPPASFETHCYAMFLRMRPISVGRQPLQIGRHSGTRLKGAGPESIFAIVVMDSGLAALRRPGMTGFCGSRLCGAPFRFAAR